MSFSDHCTRPADSSGHPGSSEQLARSAYGVRGAADRFFRDGPGRWSAEAGDVVRLFDADLRLVNFFLRPFDGPGWSGSSLSVTLQLEPPLHALKGREVKAVRF